MLAVSGLSLGVSGGVCKALQSTGGSPLPAAAQASLRGPARACLTQGSSSLLGSCRLTCLPHETSLQQDAGEKN